MLMCEWVGGGKTAGDTRRSEEQPLRDPSRDEHFRAKSVKHSWRCGARPRRNKAGFYAAAVTKKQQQQQKQHMSVTLLLI